MPEAPLRRSLLYVPGSSPKMIEKSFAGLVDGIILDLEDAVSPGEKETARTNVAACLARPRPPGKEMLVRINAVGSAHGLRDLLAVIPQRPDTIVIPKADVASVVAVDRIVAALEEERGLAPKTIGLIALMETAASIINAAAIAAAAPRLTGLQFGAEDLTKELGIPRTAVGDELHHARSALVFAGCANGIDILDTPFADHADIEALSAETRRVKAIGMTGKTCIHPKQVEVVNAVFTPTAAEIDHARRVLAAFEQAVAEGKGACSLDGRMIDAPIAARARKILEKARSIDIRREAAVSTSEPAN